jgi:hypothetical protein
MPGTRPCEGRRGAANLRRHHHDRHVAVTVMTSFGPWLWLALAHCSGVCLSYVRMFLQRWDRDNTTDAFTEYLISWVGAEG